MTIADHHYLLTCQRARELEGRRAENRILKRLLEVGWPPRTCQPIGLKWSSQPRRKSQS